MYQYLVALFAMLCCSICYGQTSPETTYFNPSIRKKESAANAYIGFYQKFISSIRGYECPMYPSCSNFGLKTFNEVNFASAFAMTSDRLLRCGHDRDYYSLTLSKDGFKFLDYPAYDTPPKDLYYSRNSYYFAYSDTITDPSPLAFIKKLINDHYYHEALLEIMRYEFQINSFDIDLFINKIICLKAIGEYEKALYEYETKCPEGYKSDAELAFQIALIQYKLGNLDQALQKTSLASVSCNDEFCGSKIALLDGLLHANKLDWEKAMQSYKLLGEFDSYEKLSKVNFQLSEEALHLKEKSPTVAGILSIIPGAGYAYAGHKQTAISALLINGLLTYATYSCFKNENYGMGILTGVFNVSFYIGNIYGAVKSTKRFNEQQKKSITNKLEFNSNF